jgi:DNA-binding protein H-NS
MSRRLAACKAHHNDWFERLLTPAMPPQGQTASATSARRRAAIIHRIRTLMEFWGITVNQLRHHKAKPAEPPPPASPKYRHPVTGDTWDGHGPQPEWLRQALLKEGYTVEQLRQVSAAAGVSPPDGDAGPAR